MVPAERKHSSGRLCNATTVALLGPEPQTQTHTHTQGLSPSPVLIQLAVMRLEWKWRSSEVDWKPIRGKESAQLLSTNKAFTDGRTPGPCCHHDPV